MSNGPIPYLTPAELSFTPGTPDFTDFVASELGNLGTDSDGFDLLLSDTISLTDEAGTLLTSFDGDLVDAGNSIAAFSVGDPATDQASLIPAANAVDAALNDYTGTLPSPNNSGTGSNTGTTPAADPCAPGTVHQGITIGQPDPNPYPPLPSSLPSVFQWHNLPSVCTGSASQKLAVANGRWNPDQVAQGLPDTGTLVYGDTAVFAESDTQAFSNAGYESWEVFLTITPTKAGQFQAIVGRPTAPGPGGPAGTGPYIDMIFVGYRITIVDTFQFVPRY